MSDTSASPPFVRIGPEQPASPVVLSVPHAGRDYGPALLAAARLPRAVLETLEDRLVDRLVWRATEAGATAFIARAPRAEIDLNRDEREIDPQTVAPPLPAGSIVQSVRTRGGIGLIPSRITGVGAIWKERISQAELARRITHIHRPYHLALERALADARERFGAALLLDCHSMPPRGQAGPASPDSVVFGDRYGTTTAPDLLDAAVAAARALGYRPACNTPYAGGYIAGRHGRPDRGIHALQMEIDRSTYLDPELRSPGPGFAGVCRLVAAVVEAIESRLLGPDQAIAAE
ncbi:MAG TPA: N-formylglutamate amidohydrolase [Allosphingosinicella sp.]|nr:N-formylglutamate amidohydrolase [Allosphingosinicella sp.]